jgi:hypothetical protein
VSANESVENDFKPEKRDRGYGCVGEEPLTAVDSVGESGCGCTEECDNDGDEEGCGDCESVDMDGAAEGF